MLRYRYNSPSNFSSVTNPSLSAGMFDDPSQLHVSAANLSNAGQYAVAAPVANNSAGYGPGWSPDGQSWSNDYQFDDSTTGALQRAGVSSQLADQVQQQQAIHNALADSTQRAAARAAGNSTQPNALTDKLAENRILSNVPDAANLALQLRRQTDSAMNPSVGGYGIADGNVMAGGQTIPIPQGQDPDAFAAQQVASLSSQRAASLSGKSQYDIFRNQPQTRDMLEPQVQALFRATYGAPPDQTKQIENVNRNIDAYTKQFGVNPIAAVNEMEARGAKEGDVIAIPGKFEKGLDSQHPTYVSGPNVHLSAGLVRIGRTLRKSIADAQGVSGGDQSASPYPAGYDPSVPSTEANQPQPAKQSWLRSLFSGSTPAPAATPAPASPDEEIKTYGGKQYRVNHLTKAVTPL